MKALTRRQLMMTGMGAATSSLMVGCATPGMESVNAQPTIAAVGSGEKITLTYWAWLKDLQEVADIWNAQNPLIQVETVWIPGGNQGGYQKLYSALAANGGPDLAQVELRAIPEFMLVNGLVDLDRYGAQEYADRFDPTFWGQVSFVDGVFGIPQDSGPMATFYQTEIFEQLGAPPPTTWPDWAEVAAEMRKMGVYLDCFPVADPSYFISYATQAGASWLKPEADGWVINMRDEATMEVARFFDDALDRDLVNTGFTTFSPAWFAACANGQLASVTDGSWADALVQGVAGGAGKWRVAPMPTWTTGGFGSSQRGGSTTAVLANSSHPREALEFAVWLNSSKEGIDALIEHSGIGWSANPDYIGSQRQEPSEFFSGQNYNTEVLVPATKQQNRDWSWWPITQQSINILSDEFRRKGEGQSLVDGVVKAEDEIAAVFRSKGLRIRKGDS